ncbi:4-diphosphocytidyl-2-C-methyl-D-erythritol kinase [Tistlia consotensis]|uniref:4-diphosphocytidyl-2-C-methyl-D-erythritol kinase n=1 Tax=Tistlia consotensis USBA 355 TaxID=560819 RepID=A0A1Y6C1S7_9PROT|nr:4-(cytidine 5'-diphospho)-2-C-methyl-D-erythritol kinase [Tistlia consotensis]SMF38983.1 4-diphosphocytidyl-2-C-methyl-D-erythritol kinase [Tistlia consotensis USBA 355]SNR36633.1 4-diphosphocytidyl-2-C-methyl-D-erythritol kinase [Tistlia consotensis]
MSDTAYPAPAKVNLWLEVVGKRADGYHLLDSLVVFAGVGDCLWAEPAADLSLAVEGPYAGQVPAGGGNLVLRAAHLLAEAAGLEPRARLVLDKRLPVAAGIGGGSSDAAAALRALSALWRLEPDEGLLLGLGAALGADVPVCLYGRPALMAGIGEDLRPAPALPEAWLVLVNPGVALSTAAVFQARQSGPGGGAFSAPRPIGPAPRDAEALAELLAGRRNDLEAPARRLCPEVDAVLGALATTAGCLLGRMSGSGATCFGLYATAAEAGAAAAAIAAEQPGWWSVAAPILGTPD